MATILCPVDFSELSAKALRLAALLGGRCARPVVAMHAVWFEAPPYLTAGPAAQIQAQLRSALDDARDSLTQFARDNVGEDQMAEVRIEEGDARDAIPRVARALDAGLIVMGTQRHTGLGRLAIGSVAGHVLHTTGIPVLTVGPKDRGRPLPNIVAAVNDSEVSRKALQHAARLAKCLDGRLTVLHVQEEHHGIPDLCAWIAGQEPLGCEVRHLRARGRVDEQILSLAGDLEAGLLVIGAEHKRFLDDTAIGVTASRIVRHASCPVMAVPA